MADAVDRNGNRLVLRADDAYVVDLAIVHKTVSLIEKGGTGSVDPVAQHSIETVSPSQQVFSQVLGIEWLCAAIGDLVTLISRVKDDPVAMLRELGALLVRKFDEAPKRSRGTRGVAMIEPARTPFLGNILQVQICLTTKGLHHLLHQSASFLRIGILRLVDAQSG